MDLCAVRIRARISQPCGVESLTLSLTRVPLFVHLKFNNFKKQNIFHRFLENSFGSKTDLNYLEILYWGQQIFICKKPNAKYFRLCRSQLFSSALVAGKKTITGVCGYIPIKLNFTKQVGFGLRAVVC